MRNYINKNIDTSIKWDRKSEEPNKQKIIGLSIFDKEQIMGRRSGSSWSDTKKFNTPTGYCGNICLSNNSLQIWTNGRYQFIKREIAIKLLKELIKRYDHN